MEREGGGFQVPNGEPLPGEGSAGPKETDLDRSARKAEEALGRKFGGPAEPPPREAPPAQPPQGLSVGEGEQPHGGLGVGVVGVREGGGSWFEQIVAEETARREQALPPEKRPFARKLAAALRNFPNALRVGLISSAKNLNFRGKDWWWRAGFVAGGVESAAFVLALPLPLKGFVKAGLNLALARGGFALLERKYLREEFQLRKSLTGEELFQKISELQEKHKLASSRTRNLFAGMTAGATYTSLGLGAWELGREVWAGMQATPPEEAAAAARAAEVAAQAKQELFEKLAQNPDYLTQKAAWVGKELPITDKIIDQALEQKGISLSELDPVTLEKARLAVQGALEERANQFFDQNLKASLPGIDPSDPDFGSVVEKGQQVATSWLATENAQAQLSGIAQEAIDQQTVANEALVTQVNSALETASKTVPDLYADQAIQHGTTVGHLLQEANYQVTWTGADAPVLGAHIAANYDMLTDMWHNMATNHLIPESPFPVGLSELNDLVSKAQAGDQEALRKLVQALHWIPAGEKFRILKQAGIRAALAALRG